MTENRLGKHYIELPIHIQPYQYEEMQCIRVAPLFPGHDFNLPSFDQCVLACFFSTVLMFVLDH